MGTAEIFSKLEKDANCNNYFSMMMRAVDASSKVWSALNLTVSAAPVRGKGRSKITKIDLSEEEERMLINHYGVKVDSERPVTGVILSRSPDWLLESAQDQGVCPSWEEHTAECAEEDHEFCEVEESWHLVGFRKDPNDEKYEPDPKAEYSAIVGETYTQVVRSTWTSRCALCSPCFPGQGDLDSEGEFLAYTLPPDLWGDCGHFPIEEYVDRS